MLRDGPAVCRGVVCGVPLAAGEAGGGAAAPGGGVVAQLGGAEFGQFAGVCPGEVA